MAIDTDPQLNLTTNMGIQINELNASLGDYLLERTSEFNPEKINDNLYLISSGANAEADMLALQSEGPYYYQILNDFLEQLETIFDVVIIDTAPAFNAYTSSAIYTSSVYSVLTPGMNELNGLNATVSFAENLGKEISGIILIKKEQTALSNQIQEELENDFEGILLNRIVRKNIALSESIITHQSIFQYSKHSNGAKDYKKVAEEIMKREGI